MPAAKRPFRLVQKDDGWHYRCLHCYVLSTEPNVPQYGATNDAIEHWVTEHYPTAEVPAAWRRV